MWRNWQLNMLSPEFPEAGELDADGEAVAEAVEKHLNTGRPLAAPEWIAMQEQALNRQLAPHKPGPKPKMREGES